MEITVRTPQAKRRRFGIVKKDESNDNYPCDLQFYKEPPTGEISLVEFQELGLERLKVLQLVDSVSIQGNKDQEGFKTQLETALRKEHGTYLKLLRGTGTSCSVEIRRNDCISHFIMRLAYCTTDDLRHWFIAKEVEFFKLRFTSLSPDGVKFFLKTNNLEFSMVSEDEKHELRDKLYSIKETDINSDYYKIAFEKVPDLVRDRKILIKRGTAYVLHHDLISVIVSLYREHLNKMMDVAKDYLENISTDERLTGFLKNLPNCFSGMTKTVWSTETTPITMLDELSKISYPLCMRTLHEATRRDHHLKHGGRQQYGLFLKGIGVSLDDALVFWKQEFCQKMDEETFNKRYRYNFRHMYGKEGKQTSYTPYGCTKIITSLAGAGEYHGCPYRQMPKDVLKAKLCSYGLRSENVTEIADLAAGGHYNLACQKCFDVTHKRPPGRPIVHPNVYYAESREILTKESSDTTQKDGDASQNSRGKVDTPTRKIESKTTVRKEIKKSNPENIEISNEDFEEMSETL